MVEKSKTGKKKIKSKTLRSEIEEKIPKLGLKTANLLRKEKITTLNNLRRMDVNKIAQKTGIQKKQLLKYKINATVQLLPSIDKDRSEILKNAGYDCLEKLATTTPIEIKNNIKKDIGFKLKDFNKLVAVSRGIIENIAISKIFENKAEISSGKNVCYANIAILSTVAYLIYLIKTSKLTYEELKNNLGLDLEESGDKKIEVMCCDPSKTTDGTGREITLKDQAIVIIQNYLRGANIEFMNFDEWLSNQLNQYFPENRCALELRAPLIRGDLSLFRSQLEETVNILLEMKPILEGTPYSPDIRLSDFPIFNDLKNSIEVIDKIIEIEQIMQEGHNYFFHEEYTLALEKYLKAKESTISLPFSKLCSDTNSLPEFQYGNRDAVLEYITEIEEYLNNKCISIDQNNMLYKSEFWGLDYESFPANFEWKIEKDIDDLTPSPPTTYGLIVWQKGNDTLLGDQVKTPLDPIWKVKKGCIEQLSNFYHIFDYDDDPPNPLSRGTYAWLNIEGSKDWDNYNIDLTMISKDRNRIGIMFRYQDKYNYYRLSMDEEEKWIKLAKVKNGIYKDLQAPITYKYIEGIAYYVHISVNNKTINFWLQAKIKFLDPPEMVASFSCEDQDDPILSGTIALYSCANDKSYWYDIKVTKVVEKSDIYANYIKKTLDISDYVARTDVANVDQLKDKIAINLDRYRVFGLTREWNIQIEANDEIKIVVNNIPGMHNLSKSYKIEIVATDAIWVKRGSVKQDSSDVLAVGIDTSEQNPQKEWLFKNNEPTINVKTYIYLSNSYDYTVNATITFTILEEKKDIEVLSDEISIDFKGGKHINFSDLIELYFSLPYILPHHLFYTLPLCIGDVYNRLGEYNSSKKFYNFVFNESLTENQKVIYPYLNLMLEENMLKIKIVDNLLDWAEEFYRKEGIENVENAKFLYQKALAVYNALEWCMLKRKLSDDSDKLICQIGSFDIEINEIMNSIKGFYNLTAIEQSVLDYKKKIQKIGEITKIIENYSLKQKDIYEMIKNINGIIKNQLALSKISPIKIIDVIKKQIDLVIEDKYIEPIEKFVHTSYNLPITVPKQLKSAPGVESLIQFLKNSFGIPENPKIQLQKEKACRAIHMINNCFNILGWRDDYLSHLRYEYLIQEAKEFLNLALNAETEFVTFKEKFEDGTLSLSNATHSLDLCQRQTELDVLKVDEAELQVKNSIYQREQIKTRICQLGDEIARLEDMKDDSWGFWDFLGCIATAAGAAISAVGTFGTSAIAIAGAVAYGVVSTGVETGTNLSSQGESINAQIERLEHEQDILKNNELPAAENNIEISNIRRRLTEGQKRIDELNAQFQAHVFQFLYFKFLNPELWSFLAKGIKDMYIVYLNYAIATAWLAERALEFEQGAQINLIKFNYFARERQGLLAADSLQQDIASLEYKKLSNEQKKKHITKVISLAQTYPIEFFSFRKTGKICLSTGPALKDNLVMEQFDYDFPGLYQRRIKNVGINILGLIGKEGIKATLTNLGWSQVVTKESDGSFSIQELMGQPESAVLSVPSTTGTQFQLISQQKEFLNPFEGIGVVTSWVFEMPKTSNNVDYSTIWDIQLIIDYRAEEDEELKKIIISQLPKQRYGIKAYSFKFDLPDQFYQLNNPSDQYEPITGDSEFDFYALKFTTQKDDLAYNERKGVKINNVGLFFDGCKSEITASLYSDQIISKMNWEIKNLKKINQNGVLKDTSKSMDPKGRRKLNGELIASNYGENKDKPKKWNEFYGLNFADNWYLVITPEDNPNLVKKDANGNDVVDGNGRKILDFSKVNDIIFLVCYTYDVPGLRFSDSFASSTNCWTPIKGNWKVEKGVYVVEAMDQSAHLNQPLYSIVETGILGNKYAISFKVKVNTVSPPVILYFANGCYKLVFGEKKDKSNKTFIRLYKLPSSYIEPQRRYCLLKEHDFVMKPNRWHNIRVKQNGIWGITVEIDDKTYISVYDSSPSFGSEIALGILNNKDAIANFDDVVVEVI